MRNVRSMLGGYFPGLFLRGKGDGGCAGLQVCTCSGNNLRQSG